MTRPRILFLVNGLGLGNSSRCYATIQELAGRGAEIEVATSENGLWFLADKASVSRITEIPSLRYGKKKGRISVGATLGNLGEMLHVLRATNDVIANGIARYRPHVVVTDSIYSFRAVRRTGVPLVALNNSDMVMHGMRRFRDPPASVLAQFAVVEFPDFLFHRLVPDLIVSPRLDPTDMAAFGRFRAVGPIVRRECQPQPISDAQPRRVAIMLSGSVFGSPVNLKGNYPELQIEVLGRPAPFGELPAGVRFYGKVLDSLSILQSADLVVINGGFSAVSEAIILRKPMVVIPVPNHAEQWVNGQTVSDLGLGLTADEGSMEKAMNEALHNIADLRAGYRRLPQIVDGSSRAAEMILSLADVECP